MGESSSKLRPAGEGRMPNKEKSNQIMKAADMGDISTLLGISHRGIDVTAARNTDGDTVLHKACQSSHSDLVQMILNSGMSVDIRNDSDSTPLHMAAANDGKCVKLLCDAGATVNVQDCRGTTPLHWAAFNRQYQAIDILVAAGAPLEIMDCHMYTPLTYAVGKGHGDVVNYLIQKHKADPNKVKQTLQGKMKELLRKEERCTNRFM